MKFTSATVASIAVARTGINLIGDAPILPRGRGGSSFPFLLFFFFWGAIFASPVTGPLPEASYAADPEGKACDLDRSSFTARASCFNAIRQGCKMRRMCRFTASKDGSPPALERIIDF